MAYNNPYQAPEARTSPYNTRSEPTVNGKVVEKKPRLVKASAVVSRERLRRQRGSIERFTAWGVLFISFLGSIVVFSGGWDTLAADIRAWHVPIAAVIGGFLLQLLLTFLEWYYFDNPIISWLARAFDAGTTALGYGPLFTASLIGVLVRWNAPQAFYLAWVIIGLVSLVIAWYPESRLVD